MTLSHKISITLSTCNNEVPSVCIYASQEFKYLSTFPDITNHKQEAITTRHKSTKNGIDIDAQYTPDTEEQMRGAIADIPFPQSQLSSTLVAQIILGKKKKKKKNSLQNHLPSKYMENHHSG